MHEYTTKSLVHATHSEWDVRTSKVLWLQYMPPTTSGMYAKACHYVSSRCHQWRVACMQEHDTQNPGRTIPWSILQRAHKTQGLALVSPTNSHHYISNTCHPQWVTCMQEHNMCIAYKTRQTQAPHLVILTSSQNPRPVLGKPRRNSTSLTKPRANTSLVQGSTNPRFILGEPFLLLSSISIGIQGIEGLPLTICSVPNWRSSRVSSSLPGRASPASNVFSINIHAEGRV